MTRNQEVFEQAAASIQQQGYRVFTAERGDYGFYTDLAGTRIIGVQIECEHLIVSGNYHTSNPKKTGTGWQIKQVYPGFNARQIWEAVPPLWAIQGTTWRYTSLTEHLAAYGSSSNYTERMQHESLAR